MKHILCKKVFILHFLILGFLVFAQNVQSQDVNTLIKRVESDGEKLSNSETLFYTISDGLMRFLNINSWPDEIISMKSIKHVPFDDPVNWFHFASVRTKNASSPFYVQYDPFNTDWGTYLYIAPTTYPKEFQEHVDKLNAEFNMARLGAENNNEYLDKRADEIMASISFRLGSNRDYLNQKLSEEINATYQHYIDLYSDSALYDEARFIQAAKNGRYLAFIRKDIWINSLSNISYIKEEIIKDDKNAAYNIQKRWIAIAESELDEQEKNIYKIIFEENINPDLEKQKKDLENQKKELEFLKNDSLVQFQLKELANLLKIDPWYVNQVLEDCLKNESNTENHPLFIWVEKYLRVDIFETDKIYNSLFSRFQNDIPTENKLDYVKVYLDHLNPFFPEIAYKQVVSNYLDVSNSLGETNNEMTKIVENDFCIDGSTGDYSRECFTKFNRYIYDGFKVLYKDFLNTFSSDSKEIGIVKNKYPNSKFLILTHENFAMQIEIGNAYIAEKQKKSLELEDFSETIQKFKKLLAFPDVKKINKSFKGVDNPSELKAVLSNYI